MAPVTLPGLAGISHDPETITCYTNLYTDKALVYAPADVDS